MSEWIVVQCFDAYRNPDGTPGQDKRPVAGFDTPMSKADALDALRRLERERSEEDFSIRRLGDVVNLERDQ